jgi:hypothetical protein
MLGAYIKFFIFAHCSSEVDKNSEKFSAFFVPVDHFHAAVCSDNDHYCGGGNDHGTAFRKQEMGLLPPSLVVENHLLAGTLPRENKRT